MSNLAYNVTNKVEDFFDLDVFSSDYLKTAFPINDGDGSKLPTSIPSPFARIDLVKNAFKELGEDGVNLDGIYKGGRLVPSDNHKLVSDALDIGQLFFNFERHREVLSMSKWNKDEELQALRQKGKRHTHLAKTFELFFLQDSDISSSYNFHRFSDIYILKFNHKVIGATSPRTLFFAAPDAKAIPIFFGNDKMLDNETRALYLRDERFIELYYVLSRTPNFPENFPEVNSYILQNIKKLYEYNNELWGRLQEINMDEYLKHKPQLLFNNNKGTPVEIVHDLIYIQRVDDPAVISEKSEFMINSNKFQDSNEALPLVLPTDTFNPKWIYTTDTWDSDTIVPCYDNLPLKERILPGQGVKYPYLTMNDFLTDEIIKLPKRVHPKYFNSVTEEDETSYMFPLTPIFFNYFSAKELIENKMIAFKVFNEALEVSLNIPTKKGIISYTKLYYHQNNINDNKEMRKGIIIPKSFSLSIFPPVKKQNNIPIDYYVGISDTMPDSRALPVVNFYNSEKHYGAIPTKKINVDDKSTYDFKPKVIEKDRGLRYNTNKRHNRQTHLKNSFDVISVAYGTIENVLIPNLDVETDAGGNIYKFAIDLGTTNTHIECSKPNSKSSYPFNVSSNESLIALLYRNEGMTEAGRQVREIYTAQELLIQESINTSFGQKDDMYESPFRTVMLHNSETEWITAKVINQANIGFDYEKKTIRTNLDITSNIKWNTDEKGLKLLELCVEELLLLCKNKVLLSNGNISETIVRWLYPVSMEIGQLDKLKDIWDKKYTEIFNGNPTNIKAYPESIAPYYEFDARKPGDRPLISIDIGGGTTDVLINDNNNIELISSFKFAGNSIYGNGTMVKNNGFVKRFAENAGYMLKDQQLTVPSDILDRILDNNKGKSEDIMSYLFSLKENKYLKTKGVDYDLARELALNGDAKMIFLLFYASLIYHIAEITKLQGLSIPRNLMFSGNGSKVLNILDSSRNQNKLNQLSLLIFQKVYDTEEHFDVEILISENPKSMTAKGAIRITDEDVDITDKINFINLIRVHNGLIDNDSMHNPRKKTMAKGLTFADFDENSSTIINKVIENYKKFLDLFSQLDDEFNFRDQFSVSLNAFEKLEELKNKDTKGKINNAITEMSKGRRENDLINETLFFYPVMALIENLSNAFEE